jgi:large subunit ribosomal protein L10
MEAQTTASRAGGAQAEKKASEIERVRDSFTRSVAAVLLDFRGIDVPQITELRARFRAQGIEYRVVKNTLVVKALVGTPLEGNAELEKHLAGPTGIAWSFEDPSAAAKIIKAFRKEDEKNEKLEVKCGVLETTILPGKRVESELATLPGKDEIRAQLLATLLAPMQSLVRMLQAPAQNLVYAMDAKARKEG